MSTLFGGMSKSRDIRDIVAMLQEGTSAICNESVAGHEISNMNATAMSESIQAKMLEHYSKLMPDQRLEVMLKEDAEDAAKMFMNNLFENTNIAGMSTVNESALMPNMVSLTASIATTMRTPYEAVLHRLYDTRTLDKQTVEIEEIIPTIKAPGDTKAEDLIDALSPSAPTMFVDRTEIEVETLTQGLVPGSGCKNLPLLEGKNPLFKVNRDVRISKIDVKIDGKAIPPERVRLARGTSPYFDAKDNNLHTLFDVTKDDGEIVTVEVTARMNFEESILNSLTADDCVEKVYFYATVDHREHTHPIYTSFRNNFQQFLVPTRPHIEVSIPHETRTDIQNSIQHYANTDIVAAMTENITLISSRMEDQRLKKGLDKGHEFEGEFSFEAPSGFAYGNLEWLKREFVPFLDQCALKMKNDWNITDCHFRVAVSPYILRILDTDYSMDKAMTEEGKGSGVINYSIGCKTSTSTFYFISSQMIADSKLQMVLIPNNFKNSQVKTYNYFKYSSFLTDQLRRADNHVQPAVVYSERNLPVVFQPLQTEIEITELPIQKTEGARWVKRVA
ncbi:hypothetical protein [uncultured Duncaniella sp.]|uniref:hypothetical protein n=1 Tax=uncultured Duncaniella sp. TaxID=2768039 RepID=UPI00260CD7CB|nr:hypothetical protein [uncultured Duncaniella sp.]